MARQKNTIQIQELPSFFPTQNFIKREENLELTAYTCPAGVKTIGWGHVFEPRDGPKAGRHYHGRQGFAVPRIRCHQSLSSPVSPCPHSVNGQPTNRSRLVYLQSRGGKISGVYLAAKAQSQGI